MNFACNICKFPIKITQCDEIVDVLTKNSLNAIYVYI